MFTDLSSYRIMTSSAGKKTFTKVIPGKEKSSVYTTAAVRPEKEVKSFYGGGFNATSAQQNVNFASPTSQQNNYTSFLDGFVNTADTKTLRLKYKDMYYFDNICGTAVDLRSELPFSDYTLTGIADPGILKLYEESMDALKPLQFLRRLLADYFVFGAVTYYMIFDNASGYFLSPMPLDLDECTFTPTPLLNDAPFIDYRIDKNLQAFITAYESGDKRVKDYVIARPGLLKLIAAKKGQIIELDPEVTLYLERNDLSYSPQTQVSYFSRALKYYEYEKRIFRGTLDLAEKRLKSILHITIGNDTILPNADTLSEISNAFKTANLDPTDAIVATHSYVQTNEVRQPTDFWRWDEISDFTNRGKMIALGINEQFLSGDMNYSSMEAALSVFLEQLLGDRNYVTDRVFYKTLFPYIAKENGFVSEDDQKRVDDQKEEVISRDIKLNPLIQEKEVHKKVQYQIPTIVWHKALKPKIDKDWLETLQMLKDQDIPIPYRMWLTAAGVDTDEIFQEYEADLDLEKAAAEYKKNLETISEEDMSSLDEEDFSEDVENFSEQEEQTDLFDTSDKEGTTNPQLFQGSSIRPIGLKNRKRLGDLNSSEVNARFAPRVSTGNGGTRKMSKTEAALYNENFNRNLAGKLAQKDKREQDLANEAYKRTNTKIIV